MPELAFLNQNERIAYPLIQGDSQALLPSGDLPKECLVDAGFMLGLDSQFDPLLHNVTLRSIEVTATEVMLRFVSDATGLTGYSWIFSFSPAAPFGCSVYSDMTPDVGGPASPDKGWGYATVGHLDRIAARGIGLYTLITPPRVEPALLQSLVKTFARSVAVGNTKRLCPDECCGSSSSLPSADGYIFASGLIGDLRFREGFNMRLSVNLPRNLIEFRAVAGGGSGKTCEDVIVDGPGPEGFKKDDGSLCGTCAKFVRSVNGLSSPSGHLQLIGAAATTVIPDKNNHLVTVKMESNRECDRPGGG